MLWLGCCKDNTSIVKKIKRTKGNANRKCYFIFLSFLRLKGMVEESSLYFVDWMAPYHVVTCASAHGTSSSKPQIELLPPAAPLETTSALNNAVCCPCESVISSVYPLQGLCIPPGSCVHHINIAVCFGSSPCHQRDPAGWSFHHRTHCLCLSSASSYALRFYQNKLRSLSF